MKKVNSVIKNSENGITLIALVITIIVMLILVSVTIRTALSDKGTIQEAKGAVNDYMDAQEEEQESLNNLKGIIVRNKKKRLNVTTKITDTSGNEITEMQPEGTNLKIQLSIQPDEDIHIISVKDANNNVLTGSNGVYNSNNITTNGVRTFRIAWLIGDVEQTEKEVQVMVDKLDIDYIGKYVKYEPDQATYSKDLLGENYTGSTDNTENFTTSEYTDGWRVLDYNKETGEMTIIMASQTKSLRLDWAQGYNNGVDILNNMCEALYSKNSWNATARSFKIEDFEDKLSQTGINRINSYVSNGGVQYNQTKEYDNNNKGSYSSNRKYPIIYSLEKGSGTTGDGTVRTSGLGLSDTNPNINYNSNATLYDEASNKLTVTQTDYYLSGINTGENIFKNQTYRDIIVGNGNSYYWIASRCVSCYNNNACFAIRVLSSSSISYGCTYYSSGSGGDFGSGVRAIVHLGTGVKLTGTESGANKNNAITIAK